MEATLVQGHTQVGLLELLQDTLHNTDMLLLSLRIYQDVIYMDNDTHIQKCPKYLVYHSLQRGRGIAQPKRHNQVFKQAVLHPESSFPLIPFGNPNEIVAVVQ